MSETNVHGIDEVNMERRTFLKGVGSTWAFAPPT